MQVTQVTTSDKDTFSVGHHFTQEQLQKEYGYIQAEKITKGLLEKGMITLEEYERIMAENRRSFPTYLAPIL